MARIWDVPVRLFHWLLVLAIVVSWRTGSTHAMEWHRRSGYAILALLVFRIYWGFVGSRNARFAVFLRGPRAIAAYTRGLFAGDSPETPGHNPLGGWSVVVLLATLAAMVTAGLFAVDVDGLESGPLADYVSFDTGRAAAHLHHLVFNILLGLIALHVLAILLYLVRYRRDLIGPMVTGRKRRDRLGVLDEGWDGDIRAPLGGIAIGIALAVGTAWLVSRGLKI